MDLSPLADYCQGIGLQFGEKQSSRLLAYKEALYAENQRANITRVPKEEAVVRHLLDSALVLDLIPQGARCLDIGSGPGLPGFVIACLRPDTSVVCMESTAKMTRPLDSVSLPNLKVRVRRAELVDSRESFEFVTGRAVANLGVQLEISAAWCKVGGCVVPFRTSSEAGQIESLDVAPLGLELEGNVERTLPGTDAVRLFPIFKKVARTPKLYPRTWAEIKRSPFGT